MQCPNCQGDNAPDYYFCIFCGSPLQAGETQELSETMRKQAVADANLNVATNYAGFQRRFVAWIIDILALIAILAIIGWAVNAVLSPSGGYVDAQVGAFCIYVIWVPLSSLYFIGFWARLGQTPGKMAMRIRIVKSDGKHPSIGKAVLRLAGSIIPAVVGLVIFVPVLVFISAKISSTGIIFWIILTYFAPILLVIVPNFLSITRNSKKQSLHDKLARTYVVNTHQVMTPQSVSNSTEIGNS